jgi:SAM-dependent methyltransferase
LPASRQAFRVHAEEFYDEYWRSGRHSFGEWDEQSFCRLLSALTGLDCVLDYGCGCGGVYRRRLSGAVRTYVGADVAEAALATLRQEGFSALRINPETGATDCGDNQFDGAACIEVFEHLFDPLQAAREINRVLKPGGVLVASVPNFGYFAWRLLALLRAQVPLEPHSNRYDGVHIRFLSKLMFTRLLRDGGFVDIRIGSWDNASVWDVFHAMGPFVTISEYARKHLPKFMHLEFLQDAWPNVFAKRLRAVARKPE